jgi:hypothetical protein
MPTLPFFFMPAKFYPLAETYLIRAASGGLCRSPGCCALRLIASFGAEPPANFSLFDSP